MEINENQQNIYNGLKSMGEEISSFYMDALDIPHSENLKSKSYLLAHVAREIDGGLRDILAPIGAKEKMLKEPSLKDRGKLLNSHHAHSSENTRLLSQSWLWKQICISISFP